MVMVTFFPIWVTHSLPNSLPILSNEIDHTVCHKHWNRLFTEVMESLSSSVQKNVEVVLRGNGLVVLLAVLG